MHKHNLLETTWLDHSLADSPFRWSQLLAMWASETALGGKIMHAEGGRYFPSSTVYNYI